MYFDKHIKYQTLTDIKMRFDKFVLTTKALLLSCVLVASSGIKQLQDLEKNTKKMKKYKFIGIYVP